MSAGIYVGRLVADGEGNLLADEGDRQGDPVAFHEGSYVFLSPGDESHNARHSNGGALEVTPTQAVDPTFPGHAAEDDPDTAHHFAIDPNDPHYKPGAPADTKIRNSPDKTARVESGHTETYVNG